MVNYDDKIDNAFRQLSAPGAITPTGGNPIVYLAYLPQDVMIVRNALNNRLKPIAEYYGFTVHVVSIGQLVEQFIRSNSYFQLWQSPIVGEADLFKSIRQEFEQSQFLENELIKIQDNVQGEKPLIVLKDVEMLHPFNMMGAIENRIYNKIRVPMLVLYPGETQGKSARSFLNIYNQDGNYRSVNV